MHDTAVRTWHQAALQQWKLALLTLQTELGHALPQQEFVHRKSGVDHPMQEQEIRQFNPLEFVTGALGAGVGGVHDLNLPY